MPERNVVICGDCLEVMRDFPDNSVDAIVTDPPYGLSFMGKDWDHGIPGVPFWQEALRVAKPGAHILAFGGTRTHHRLMVAIEDAGWEIRDCLMWLYGSGFPKSLDVSKAIDKLQGAEREVIGQKIYADGKTRTVGQNKTMHEGWQRPWRIEDPQRSERLTAPSTDAAKQWSGWGTALKPAWEPIVLARKPLEGTVAENVLKWGTGGINVDGGRIDAIGYTKGGQNRSVAFGANGLGEKQPRCDGSQGRWPANLLLDEEAAVMVDAQSGELTSGANPIRRGSAKFKSCYGEFEGQEQCIPARGVDSGGASRFFYTAKANSSERNKHLTGIGQKCNDGRDTPIDNPFQRGETIRKNHHPTVKPVDLLQYLCRLITPPGGLILDPFAGSGSTGIAAHKEGFDYVLIEIDEEYAHIAKMRNAQKRIGEFAQ